MQVHLRNLLVLFLLTFPFAQARADEYADTIKVFRAAGESGQFFNKNYGYAVFPTIGTGGIGIGGAHGSGRVYAEGQYAGDTSMTQVTVGLQLGGQAYSEIISSRTSAPSTSSPAVTSSSAPRRAPWPLPRVPRRRRPRVALARVRAAANETPPLRAATTRAWRSSPSRKAG